MHVVLADPELDLDVPVDPLPQYTADVCPECGGYFPTEYPIPEEPQHDLPFKRPFGEMQAEPFRRYGGGVIPCCCIPDGGYSGYYPPPPPPPPPTSGSIIYLPCDRCEEGTVPAAAIVTITDFYDPDDPTPCNLCSPCALQEYDDCAVLHGAYYVPREPGSNSCSGCKLFYLPGTSTQPPYPEINFTYRICWSLGLRFVYPATFVSDLNVSLVSLTPCPIGTGPVDYWQKQAITSCHTSHSAPWIGTGQYFDCARMEPLRDALWTPAA